MLTGAIQKLITLFHESFDALEVNVQLDLLEHLSVRVHSAMTAHTRNFHTLEHVFNFVDQGNPIRTLAALYHDIVYYQVDAGFSPDIEKIVAPYIVAHGDKFVVSKKIDPQDRMIWVTMEVFDLAPGRRLSSVDALNEFLSAVVMVKELEHLVRDKDLLRMVICIEATIPFRGLNKHGESHFDILERRLHAICEKYSIDLTREEIEASVKIAVIFANKDIENFAERDPARFLDNTWRLLPETNYALRVRSVYSIYSYRHALEKMERFLSGLKPEEVFNRYHGAPPDDEFEQMGQAAHKNIITAREYLRIKLLAIGVVEALAEMTGGDAPLSLFLGDVPQEAISVKRVEHYLPEVDSSPWVDRSSVIYRLLETGRGSDAGFDTRNSPLSLFVYRILEPDKFSVALDLSRSMFAGKISAHDFLAGIPKQVTSAIAYACAQMVFTRKQSLLAIADEFKV